MKPAAALLPILLLGTPALAEDAPVPGRYQFQPVEGGLARLDTATGEIAICRIEPARARCDADPAARAAPAPAVPPAAERGDDAEFDRALGRMKRVFRAFGDIARELDERAPEAVPNRT